MQMRHRRVHSVKGVDDHVGYSYHKIKVMFSQAPIQRARILPIKSSALIIAQKGDLDGGHNISISCTGVSVNKVHSSLGPSLPLHPHP